VGAQHPGSEAMPRWDRVSDKRYTSPWVSGESTSERLWELHREIIRLVLHGHKNVEIAAELGIGASTVSYVRNSPLGRLVLKEMAAKRDEVAITKEIDIARRVQEYAPKALALLEEIIEGKQEEASIALRQNTAKHYLGMAGHSPIQKVATLSGSLSRDELEELKGRAVEAGRALGVIAEPQPE